MKLHAVLVVLEGVLAAGNAPIGEAQPVKEGMAMVRSFQESGATVLVWTGEPKEQALDWMRRQGLSDVHLMEGPKDTAVRSARFLGHDISLYIDADPSGCATSVAEGAPTLCFVSPSYSRPQFRPDYDNKVRPWDEMVSEAQRQAEALAADPRRDVERTQDGRFDTSR